MRRSRSSSTSSGSAPGHAGFDPNYFHYLHHRYFECNYGGDGSVPIDRWICRAA